MKKAQALLFGICLLSGIQAQTPQLPTNEHCKVSTTNQSNDPVLIKEREDLEDFTQVFSSKAMPGGNCYVIPVVFHVYGTTQGGMPVNDAIIIDALDKVNMDFHGQNPDFGTVHNSFLGIRGTMADVIFKLAEKDPGGNPTTGIIYHPIAAGFANGSGYDAAIQADAWDNYMYMNVYVMNDLFDDAVTTNSGYAYYPSTSMSNNNLARVVYNGAYLGINCTWEPEFASTLSHEFGHWLNLIHTFDGGCVAPNDNVADTPPCDYLGAPYACHPSASANSPLNCTSNLINAENYMDYCGAGGCYKMFTTGQTARMYAALQVASRQPLWQLSNLTATGLSYLCGIGFNSLADDQKMRLYPNPGDGIFSIEWKDQTPLKKGTVVEVMNTIGQVIFSKIIGEDGSEKLLLDISENPGGIYFVNIYDEGGKQTLKLIKK